MRHTLLALALTGCTGFSLGENVPGGDTWVDPDPPAPGEHRVGAIAVEPDQDQLWAVHEENRNGALRSHLDAIDPVTGATEEVMDVSGYQDRRVVFPSSDRMILMAQAAGHDHLVLFDTNTRRAIAETEAPTWYWGTRTSPSGRAVVVADNADPLAPLHVIDTATLDHQVIEHGGEAIEAMWDHHSDILLAVSVADPGGADPVASLLRYDLRGADLGQPLPAPSVAWQLAGYDWDEWFSFTWIGISPDDHWAVFPLIKRTTGPDSGAHVLLVLDQTTGAVSLVPGSGPVGFTRDSQRIVSYGARAGGGGEDLWLIDPVTHAQATIAMPFDGDLSFAVGDQIVCTAPLGGSSAAIVDPATGAVRTVDASFDLLDYVTRPSTGELWLDTWGELSVLSIADATDTPVPLGVAIESVAVRPDADQAIVGEADAATILRVSMADRTVTGAPIALPSPFDTLAEDSLGDPGGTISTAARRVQSRFDPEYRATDRAPR